jgi:hypothetical protein
MGMKNNENKEIEDWRNEHGEPNFAYLESLKKDGDIEALEKLQSIASDLGVDFATTTPAEELIDMIRLTTQENEDGNADDNN